jgi:hypothetical protein
VDWQAGRFKAAAALGNSMAVSRQRLGLASTPRGGTLFVALTDGLWNASTTWSATLHRYGSLGFAVPNLRNDDKLGLGCKGKSGGSRAGQLGGNDVSHNRSWFFAGRLLFLHCWTSDLWPLVFNAPSRESRNVVLRDAASMGVPIGLVTVAITRGNSNPPFSIKAELMQTPLYWQFSKVRTKKSSACWLLLRAGFRQKLLCIAAVAVCTGNVGCIQFAANMIHAIRGSDLPAEYAGLAEKRVAVICSVDGTVASEASGSVLTSYISSALNQNLPKTTVIGQEEVDRWLEIEGWSSNDALAIGKGVKADQVVSVQVSNFKLREGATLYRGSCDIRVSVYDINADGRLAFIKEINEHAFPRIGGTPVTDTTEAKFRSAYLHLIASKIAGLFHPIDPTAEYALDVKSAQL